MLLKYILQHIVQNMEKNKKIFEFLVKSFNSSLQHSNCNNV